MVTWVIVLVEGGQKVSRVVSGYIFGCWCVVVYIYYHIIIYMHVLGSVQCSRASVE